MPEATTAMRKKADEEEEESAKEFRFFMPSTELTNAILEQNQQLVSEHVERNFPPGYQRIETDSQAQEGSLLGRWEAEMLRSTTMFDPSRQTAMGRRLISERLYNYISSLAETPRALEGAEFPIWEFVPPGMATMLGLSAYREMPADSAKAIEIRRVLAELTGEFRHWLLAKQHGTFVTPWLKIDLTSQDGLLLTAIEDEGVSEDEAYLDLVSAVVEFKDVADTNQERAATP